MSTHDQLVTQLRGAVAELVELEARHVNEVPAGRVLAGVAATVGAAAVAVPALVLPLADVDQLWWLLLPGLPLAGVAGRWTWRVLRPLTAHHGSVAAAHRAATRRRDEAWDALYALPPAAGGGVEEEWAAVREVYGAVRAADAAAGFVDGADGSAAFRNLGRHLAWAIGALALVVAETLVVAGVAAGTLTEPWLWPMLLPGAVLLVGWAPALRICALRAFLTPRRVTRTQRRAWRAELAYRRARLAAAGVPPWRHPAFHTQRLWLIFGGPLWRRLGAAFAASPAETLRALPADASPLRRWYWRYVGSGTLTLTGIVLFALLVTSLRGAP
ncbi:hypothetical protein FH609_023715 [Streptomyces sp. 3MP-14]|uniref:Uncharacterized protein n=1 Tax=Streptomyces mimosae TaxID=2586635 RepID=A0A5N6AC20_9ACTN|nr:MULTISPECIES: hypothetical protein [Streptomyces]KAB8166367.1 hypothetical protein FH607_011075 [Streptomyces mimosae]KAB8174160.1 hypothetical protein FH609_023715 [Streptomyces sp. 3MP-14]